MGSAALRIPLPGNVFFEIDPHMNSGIEDFLVKHILSLPTKITRKSVTEYVNDKRIMPPESRIPGPYDVNYTPYHREIQDNLSAGSPIRITTLMKAHQLGATTIAENVICYWMDEHPASVMFMSATDDLLQQWSYTRLDPAIDSLGFRHKIVPQSGNKKQRRTGDKTDIKEFPGGCLRLVSARSAGKQRSAAVRVLVRDETDGAPAELNTGEGSFMAVSEARTSSFDQEAKIFNVSTPTLVESSAIYQEYLKGDQRKWLIPCPHCGSFQELVWENTTGTGTEGMKWELNAQNGVERVWYECAHCKGEIQNHHKQDFLKLGYWQPTAVASDPFVRSYHLNSLYSPVGMLSWLSCVRKFLDAQQDPDGMRWFKNLYLGLPFEETGSRPSVQTVLGLRGSYSAGTVPDGVLYTTMAADVQTGSKTDKANPPRIELEVCGHGLGYRTWSIAYKVIIGEVDDPDKGAWAELAHLIQEGKLTFSRSDGFVFTPVVQLIDSGTETSTVYDWCKGFHNTFPCKGDNDLRRQKSEAITSDDKNQLAYIRYRFSKGQGDVDIVTMSTNQYKDIIYRNIGKARNHTGQNPAGFMDFPKDYPDKYFTMLAAEEKLLKGGYTASGRRNESLDCRVYNLCAGEIYINSEIKSLQYKLRRQGLSPSDIDKIGSKVILEQISAQTARILPNI